MRTKRTSNWLKRIGLSAVLSVLPGFAAWAQTPQKATPSLEMALAPGTTVWITDAVGHEAKTRIVSVSGDVVTTASGEDVRRLRTTDVTRVRVRHSDPVLNGAVIGAGAGGGGRAAPLPPHGNLGELSRRRRADAGIRCDRRWRWHWNRCAHPRTQDDLRSRARFHAAACIAHSRASCARIAGVDRFLKSGFGFCGSRSCEIPHGVTGDLV